MTAEGEHGGESTAAPPDPAPDAPVDPDLAALQAAFARGDFLETRRQAAALLQRDDRKAEDRAEAERLLGATSVDPLAIALGIGCLVFFLLVVVFTLIR